ncbi:MAG TPA: hypothetical protein ACHBX0_02710 [Arsenophonus sp.]
MDVYSYYKKEYDIKNINRKEYFQQNVQSISNTNTNTNLALSVKTITVNKDRLIEEKPRASLIIKNYREHPVK